MENGPSDDVLHSANVSAPKSTLERNRWTVLAIVSLAELLGMSPWFTASAVSPQLADLWALEPTQTSWLTTAVLIGFVAGTALAAILNLADILPARLYFAASAVLAAAVNVAVAIAPDAAIALMLRFLTGFFLAGVYPPAMKMIATWFRAARGIAIGTVVGALTIGKALPFLIHAFEGVSYPIVIASASGAAVLGAILVALFYEDGPEPFERRPFSWSLVAVVVHDSRTRLAIGGYLGHMWELYAGWTALSLFFYDFFAGHGLDVAGSTSAAALCAFGGIAVGGLGSVVAGSMADRLGRENVACTAMLISAACSLTIGWLIGAPVAPVVLIAMVWGFSIVADSAQFSALVTEVAPRHAVGTALTLQTSIGFLLSAFTIWLMVEVEARFGWGIALSMLAVGPLAGILAMLRLRELKSAATDG